MIGIRGLFHLAVLLLSLLSTQAYTSRMEDRGYNPDPYSNSGPAEDEREEEHDPGRYDADYLGRMDVRGYNDGPVEDNVSGVDCMLNERGAYGSIDGEVKQNLIEFKYQLETKPDAQSLVEEILVPLEKAFLDKLLPILFADMCGRRRQMLQVRRRRLKVIGATVNPDDVPLEGELMLMHH